MSQQPREELPVVNGVNLSESSLDAQRLSAVKEMIQESLFSRRPTMDNWLQRWQRLNDHLAADLVCFGRSASGTAHQNCAYHIQ